MKRAYIDITLEVPARDLATQPDPTRYLWETMRDKADATCHAAGAMLRTDSTPEVIVSQAHSPILGDVTLVASRWAVDVPGRVNLDIPSDG